MLSKNSQLKEGGWNNERCFEAGRKIFNKYI